MDDHPVIPGFTMAKRAWVYRVLTALAPLAMGYGIMAEHEVFGWLGVAAALLGLGTAAAHTPTGEPVARDDEFL